MAGKYSKNEKLKVAFVVTPDHIRYFVKLIYENMGAEAHPIELKFGVTFPGGASLQTTSLDEVLALPNSGNKEIKGLELRTNYYTEPEISLSFQSTSSWENVTYSVTGTDKQVFSVAAELEHAIARTRQRYTFVSNANFVLTFAFLWGLIGGILVVVVGLNNSGFIAVASALTMMVVVLTVGSLATKLRRYLFPPGIFTIGDGCERYKRIRFWRQLLGVGVVLATALELAVAVILAL